MLKDNRTPNNTSDDFILFTPNRNFSGDARFDYTLSDGNGGTDTGQVTVTVGKNINGSNGKDTIPGTPGNDILNGGNGNDTLTGLAGDDLLLGSNGNDRLDGGAGTDLLIGGNGVDRLRGGSGNDFITGGNGEDLFVLAATEGTDTVLDFQNGSDRFGLAGGLTFGQLSRTQSDNNTLIHISATNEVLASLTGVNVNLIGAEDFTVV